MKRVLICFTVVLMMNFSLISAANTVSFSLDGKSYLLKLNAAYDDRADLVLNGVMDTLSHVQHPHNDTGYVLHYIFPSSPEICFVLRDSSSGERGTLKYSDMLVGVEKSIEANLSNPGTLAEFNINGTSSVIKLKSLDISRSELVLDVNGIQTEKLEPAFSPYDILKNPPINGLRFVLKDLRVRSYQLNISSIDLIIFFEANLSIGNQSVNDEVANNISPTSNITYLPTPTINCTKDSDCPPIIGMGSPECKGNQVCISSMYNKCMNPGTAASECASSTSEKCTDCPYGCKDNACLEKAEEKEPGKINWWIVGAVILVIIIIAVYFLKKRNREQEFWGN